MRLGAALVGNLEQVMAGEIESAAHGISYGTSKTTEDLKARLRQQAMTAFGSQRLANTWRSALYPRLPKTSMGAAGTVFSNAPHIVEAFDAATVIRSKDGFFLAIPAPDAPRMYQGRRVTPSNWDDARYGPLRFVYRPGKSSLLVVDGVTRKASGRIGRQLKNGGVSKSGAYRKGVTTVVMFFLVPFVRLKKVFDLDRDYDRALTEMAGNIIEAWKS